SNCSSTKSIPTEFRNRSSTSSRSRGMDDACALVADARRSVLAFIKDRYTKIMHVDRREKPIRRVSMSHRSLRPLGAALVLSALAAGQALAQPSDALIEARRHMLNAEINTLTFRSMEMLYDTLRVANEGEPEPLAERPAALDFTYSF